MGEAPDKLGRRTGPRRHYSLEQKRAMMEDSVRRDRVGTRHRQPVDAPRSLTLKFCYNLIVLLCEVQETVMPLRVLCKRHWKSNLHRLWLISNNPRLPMRLRGVADGKVIQSLVATTSFNRHGRDSSAVGDLE